MFAFCSFKTDFTIRKCALAFKSIAKTLTDALFCKRGYRIDTDAPHQHIKFKI